jgi:hypothetical protein
MQINTKKNQKIYPKSKDPWVRRSEKEMTKILKEVQSGLLTKRGACFKYGLSRNTLKLFMSKYSIRTFGGELASQVLSTMNDDQISKALNRRIQELTKDLDYAKLKILSLETMIKVAEDDLDIKIRKKRGTKQLKE